MMPAAGRAYWSDPLTWASHLGIFVFGIALATLGSILPTLFESIRLNPAEAGSLFLFLNLGALLATLFGGPTFDRFGYRLFLVLSALSCGAGLCSLAVAASYGALVAGSFLLGLGGGGLNVGTNALVADLYPERAAVALNRLGVFFGLGTFTIPLVIGVLLSRLGLAGILFVTAGLAAVTGIIFTSARFPAPKQAAGFPMSQALGLLRDPVILVLAVLLFFQSGNEITTSGWLTTFAVERLGATPGGASFYLSTFWGALIVGRFAASWALQHWSAATVVQTGALGSAVSLGLLLVAGDSQTGYLYSGLTGLFMALIFPTVIGQASSRYPALSGTVIGVLISVALTGGMLVPWAAGLAAEWAGITAAMVLPCAGFLVVFGLQGLARRY
ncbi:MAG: hypothetical protein Kow001_23090 [Acidobacteriota bacterium]